MRPSADEWSDPCAAVPLTGREPVLGALRSRWAAGGTGFGWVTLSGPPGSGVSRVLAEAAALLVADGLPPPIRIQPAAPGAPPLEAVRGALLARATPAGRAALLRSLAFLGAGVPGGDRALAWLRAGPRVVDPSPPPPGLVRRLLAWAAGGAPLLVDDLERLDPASRRALCDGDSTVAIGVLAGTTGPEPVPARGIRIALEPLTEAQVHLLLKRWLRQPSLARHLAREAWAATGGWPGRVVRLVQTWAAAGDLGAPGRDDTGRGARAPVAPPPPPPVAFLRWVRSQGPSLRRLLEAAAVHGGPLDADLLARACGVKRSAAADFLFRAEVAGAERGGAWMFPDEPSRDSLLQELGTRRRTEIQEHLATAWRERPASSVETIEEACLRLRALLAGSRGADALPAAGALLDRMASAGSRDAVALVPLADAVRRAPPEGEGAGLRSVALAAVDLLTIAGRRDEALRILRLPATRRVADPRGLGAAWRLARLERLAGRRAAASRRLERALATDAPPAPSPDGFDARVERALVLGAAGSTPGGAVRAAWRAALAHLPRQDVGRRRLLHTALADLAERDGRRRAAASHLRREAALARAQGDRAAAAASDLRRGRLEARTGRAAVALDVLRGAIGEFLTLDDPASAAQARLEAGTACVRLHAFDEAVAQLEAAAEAFRTAPAADADRWHLALAQAYEGRGDMAAARRLAALARGARAPAAPLDLEADLLLSRTAVRAGDLSVAASLQGCETALRRAGRPGEASSAARTRADAHLRAGDGASAAAPLDPGPRGPEDLLLRARLRMLCGERDAGRRGFEAVARDPGAAVHVRAEAYARLACALVRVRESRGAGEAAAASAALLEVRRRSRAEDARVHRMLAVAFAALGERGRSALHRAEARRLQARLSRAVPLPSRGAGRRSSRLLDPARARQVA